MKSSVEILTSKFPLGINFAALGIKFSSFIASLMWSSVITGYDIKYSSSAFATPFSNPVCNAVPIISGLSALSDGKVNIRSQ